MPREKIELDEKEVKITSLKLKNITISDFINKKYKKIFKENNCIPMMFMIHNGGSKLPIIFTQSPENIKNKEILIQIMSEDTKSIEKIKNMFINQGE